MYVITNIQGHVELIIKKQYFKQSNSVKKSPLLQVCLITFTLGLYIYIYIYDKLESLLSKQFMIITCNSTFCNENFYFSFTFIKFTIPNMLKQQPKYIHFLTTFCNPSYKPNRIIFTLRTCQKMKQWSLKYQKYFTYPQLHKIKTQKI